MHLAVEIATKTEHGLGRTDKARSDEVASSRSLKNLREVKEGH